MKLEDFQFSPGGGATEVGEKNIVFQKKNFCKKHSCLKNEVPPIFVPRTSCRASLN